MPRKEKSSETRSKQVVRVCNYPQTWHWVYDAQMWGTQRGVIDCRRFLVFSISVQGIFEYLKKSVVLFFFDAFINRKQVGSTTHSLLGSVGC